MPGIPCKSCFIYLFVDIGNNFLCDSFLDLKRKIKITASKKTKELRVIMRSKTSRQTFGRSIARIIILKIRVDKVPEIIKASLFTL